MIDLQQLAKHKNQMVDLTFTDGHAVRAKLLTVDLDEPTEIIYDIIEVLSHGPAKLKNVQPGTVAAADPTLLATYSVVR